MLRLYSISDRYIAYMRKQVPNVYDPHEYYRIHSRKYVGVVIMIKGIRYFAPLSSPKQTDYDQEGKIRPSTLTILRLTRNNGGVQRLLSTLRISHMIPVPDSEITYYDVKKETDLAYKDLVEDELRWIEHNDREIISKAKRVYYLKMNEEKTRNYQNHKMIDAILPFKKLEELYMEWR